MTPAMQKVIAALLSRQPIAPHDAARQLAALEAELTRLELRQR